MQDRLSLGHLRRKWASYDVATPAENRWVVAPSTGRAASLGDFLVVTLFTAVATVLLFELWSSNPHIPFGYGGDGHLAARDAKTMIQTGWVQTNDRLGAPFIQKMFDYPISADNGNYIVMWIMSQVVRDWGLLINGFFLFGFFTASWAGLFSLRWLGCGRRLSIVGATLFSFTPYHFLRGAGHLMLASSYFVVAVAVVLGVRVASGDSLRRPREPEVPLRWRGIRWQWVLLCIACGSFGAYYAFFTMFTIIFAGFIGVAAFRSTRPLIAALLHTALVAATFAFHILPNLLYRYHNGVNYQVATRLPVELDLYGLRVIQLFTPVPGHRLESLNSISRELSGGFASEPMQYLGTIGAVGLGALLLWYVISLSRPERALVDARNVLAPLGLLWVLVATTGGLSWMLRLVGFGQLRAWNRISIMLLFISLAWGGLTVGKLRLTRVRSLLARRYVGALAMTFVVILGILDQVPASSVPNMRAYAGTFQSDAAFFGGVEATLPTSSMVYQLPFRRFPEEPATFGSGDYDLLRPFLNTEDLRWSYGGMKGREADWQASLQNLEPADLIRVLVSVGFEGMVIDRYGYSDQAVELERSLGEAVGRPLTWSHDGRWAFLDLTGLAGDFVSVADMRALRAEFLESPRLAPVGCSQPEGQGEDQFLWCGPSGTLTVVNPDPDRPTRLTARVATTGAEGTLVVSVDGRSLQLPIGPNETQLDVEIPVSASAEIQFSTDVTRVAAPGDARDMRFRLIGVALTEVG